MDPKCAKPQRVQTDVDEFEVWHCVKHPGHSDEHYVVNADHSSGRAVPLSPEEEAYQKGLRDGAWPPLAIASFMAVSLSRHAEGLRALADQIDSISKSLLDQAKDHE